MSGHSHWAGIKHKKGIIDAKRGKVFTRLIREIMIAAKHGGGKPESNPRLRKAIEDCRAANMANDTIKRAIQKGTGELPGQTIEETTYEGYGPGGVAIFVEATTDNKNRTTSDLRHLFDEHGGNMGESGCVAWMFELKGLLTVLKSAVSEDKITELVIDAGAEDIHTDDDNIYEVLSAPADLEAVKTKLAGANIPVESAAVSLIPKNTIKLEGDDARKCLELVDALDDYEDVKSVNANFDIDQKVLDNVAGGK